mgnify:CR=1 FL=1
MSKGLNRGRFVTSPRSQSQPPPRSIHTPWAPKHPCARPKSIPPTFGTLDMTVLPPTRNMSEILDGGKVCNFPQISKKRLSNRNIVPPKFPASLRIPIHTPWARKHPLHQPQNPNLIRPPPHSGQSTAALLQHAAAGTPTLSSNATATATPSRT